ncbi:putative membrane chloride channel (bestrophin family) [Silvibacterium bohemicum]|uniref:Putative membrane chloride channel (Bestrophin family) n=2 Tax=Silvibacterium bohemicum TaxID=1577686 RepID=A0A841JX06_9BACT|nr:putative membrane chloride channel (bestrophin family) [Silvibacterium bohemicum]
MWRLSVLRRIAPQIASVLVWSFFVTWANSRYAVVLRGWTVAPFTLLGVPVEGQEVVSLPIRLMGEL